MITTKWSGGEETKEILCKSQDGVDALLKGMMDIFEIKTPHGAWIKLISKNEKELLVQYYEPAHEEIPPTINVYRAILTTNGLYSFMYSTKDVNGWNQDQMNFWANQLAALDLVDVS